MSGIIRILVDRKWLVAYMCLILLLVVLPINNHNSKLNHMFVLELRGDYWIHMLVFIPWTFLYSIGSRFQNKMLNIVLGISFAVISEGFQFFIPYRAFNVNDAVANSAGVILGSTQWLFKRRN